MVAKFSVVKRGYDQKEVDSYIEKLEAELKGYREKESAISNALICAEAASSQTIKKAEEKAFNIIEQARNELDEEIVTIEKMIVNEKKVLHDFCSEYDDIVKNYFTGTAFEITAPLREKLNLIECILAETKNRGAADAAQSDGMEAEGAEEANSDGC